MFRIYFFLVFLVLAACGPHSMHDFRGEGRAVIGQLIEELKKIDTRAALLQHSPRLEKLFHELVDIMIAASEFYEEHSDAELVELQQEEFLLSEQLQAELSRLSRIDGCRDILEKIQEESLLRLGAFEKKLEKKKQRFT